MKKRKLKKKNNKLISQKHFGLVDKAKENKNNLTNQFCKSIHEFSYIVSNGAIIKESSSNEPGEINIKNNKCSISSDKINKKFNKNVGLKKVNSVNEINITNSFKNVTINKNGLTGIADFKDKGYLTFGIAYDDCWEIFVDGKKAKKEAAK